MQLSIRSQLGAVILLVIIFITTLLGIVAYNQSRKAIDDYAVRLISATAENRRDMLLVHLHRERELAGNLLESIALACGPSGRVNGICARESLLVFLRQERALAGRVALTPKYSVQGGDLGSLPPPDAALGPIVFPADRHNVHWISAGDHSSGLAVSIVYVNDDIDILFSNTELGPTGSVQLLDAAGALIATHKEVSPATSSPQVAQLCRTNISGALLTRDANGKKFLDAYRPVPELGGCVVARVDQASALAASRNLRRTFVIMALVFIALGVLISYGLAWLLTKPIARLERSVRSLEAGNFDAPVMQSGPSEIRRFAGAFARMASSLKQSRFRLVEKERAAATANLASALAHQINNPLAALTYALTLVRMHFNDEPATQTYLAVADEETGRITRIVKSILALYSEGSTLQPVLLSALVEKVFARRFEALNKQELDVSMHLDFSGTLRVYARELEQAIGHIIDNAITFLPIGSKITVHVYPSREWKVPNRPGVRIIIADNGPGIPRDQRSAIFEPFVSTRPERGSGLGLWITQAVAHKHGGYVRVHSSSLPGRTGTVFAVFLPISEAEMYRTAS
jgi:signal transduction histidine kinase